MTKGAHMKNIIQKIGLGLLFVPLLAFGATVVSPHVNAATCSTSNLSIASGATCAQGNDQPADLIMLFIGGIRYVISGGDQNQVKISKNTILYGIVGIVVAFLAYAAVNFVTQALIGGTTTNP